MLRWSRRGFLWSSFVVGGSSLWGCPSSPLPREGGGELAESVREAGTNERIGEGLKEPVREPAPDEAVTPDASPDTQSPEPISDATPEISSDAKTCQELFDKGQMLGVVPFVNEGGRPLNQLIGQGWDGRLYYDLSELKQELLITPNDKFYVRTRYPDQIDPSKPWQIRVGGLVEAESALTMADIEPLVRPMGSVLLECSGNGKGGSYGLLSAATWSGVPVDEILSRLKPTANATRVLISGFDQHSTPSTHSTPGCSWVFTAKELKEYGAFFATKMNGVPLPKDHGFPVRLVIPRWYGCTNVKWVDEIRFVDDTEPATAQMKEFASRTHQTRQHALAKDYAPATMDQAAMPVRIERWRVEGKLVYRVIGVMWGGYEVTTSLSIRFGSGSLAPVHICPAPTTNDTWSLWEHRWTPEAPGRFQIRLAVTDPKIRTRRLDSDFYLREVEITEV